MKSLFLSFLLVAFGCVAFGQSDNTKSTTAGTKLEENHPAVADRLDEAAQMLKELQ